MNTFSLSLGGLSILFRSGDFPFDEFAACHASFLANGNVEYDLVVDFEAVRLEKGGQKAAEDAGLLSILEKQIQMLSCMS